VATGLGMLPLKQVKMPREYTLQLSETIRIETTHESLWHSFWAGRSYSVLELLCNSLCGPWTNLFGDRAL